MKKSFNALVPSIDHLLKDKDFSKYLKEHRKEVIAEGTFATYTLKELKKAAQKESNPMHALAVKAMVYLYAEFIKNHGRMIPLSQMHIDLNTGTIHDLNPPAEEALYDQVRSTPRTTAAYRVQQLRRAELIAPAVNLSTNPALRRSADNLLDEPTGLRDRSMAVTVSAKKLSASVENLLGDLGVEPPPFVPAVGHIYGVLEAPTAYEVPVKPEPIYMDANELLMTATYDRLQHGQRPMTLSIPSEGLYATVVKAPSPYEVAVSPEASPYEVPVTAGATDVDMWDNQAYTPSPENERAQMQNNEVYGLPPFPVEYLELIPHVMVNDALYAQVKPIESRAEELYDVAAVAEEDREYQQILPGESWV